MVTLDAKFEIILLKIFYSNLDLLNQLYEIILSVEIKQNGNLLNKIVYLLIGRSSEYSKILHKFRLDQFQDE